MRRDMSWVSCLGVLALSLGCAGPAVTDTRYADVKAVKDLEAAWVNYLQVVLRQSLMIDLLRSPMTVVPAPTRTLMNVPSGALPFA